MAEAQRFAIALVAGVIFLSSIPFVSAESTDDPGLTLEILDYGISKTYIEGDIVQIQSKLVNNGNSVVFQENPACDVYITVQNEDNETLYSNVENCRNQSRDYIINQNEVLNQTTQQWDFKNDDGLFVESGKYTITIHHSKMPLSDWVNVEYKGKPVIDKNIKLNVELNRFNSIYQEDVYIAQFILHNPSNEVIDLMNIECGIIVNYSDTFELIDSCFSGTLYLHPNENIYAGHLILTKEKYNLPQEINFKLYGSQYGESIIIGDTENNQPDSSINDHMSNNLEQSDISIDYFKHDDSLAFFATFEDEYLTKNAINCKGTLEIYHDYGKLLLTDEFSICDNENESVEHSPLKFYEWELTNQQKCYVSHGKYTIIIELENKFFGFDYDQLTKNTDINCHKDNSNVIIQSTMTDESIHTSIQISTSETYLRVDSECLANIKITILNDEDYKKSFCGYEVGNFFTITDGLIALENQFSISEVTGQKNFEVEVTVLNGLLHRDNAHITSLIGLLPENSRKITINGIWNNVNYGNNTCWVLNTQNSAHMIDSSMLTSGWRPKEGWTGSYQASIARNVGGNCGIYGIPIVTIEEIYHELQPTNTAVSVDLEDGKSNEIDVVTITMTGTASVSIIVTLVLLISNTESIRIPATSAGLWMLALVGKTHETSDGRFQRGRLIGYLTANPGCHFRALMAALNMSNGQITHHLRLLENQELIWRINDGRFVRYYPLNNSLYPGMNPDDLPVPPLSPDPKSLQGKILTLLDDEHQIGEFPTQSELAKKLEKSQQLISHHLRTLQKYGLVEKRKMGIKNRYKLTKEALFLLETDIDYNKIRD